MTYADMVTLLLCLFVGLLSMSAIKPELFQNALGSLQGTFGSKKAAASSVDEEAEFYRRVRRELSAWTGAGLRPTAEEEVKWASLVPKRHGSTLRVSGQEVFALGESVLGVEAQEMLMRLAEVLATKACRIDIEGHSFDEVDDRGEARKLSYQRAASVARLLEKGGVPARAIRVVALADADHLVPHAYTRERKELNRGVVITIEESNSLESVGF